MLVEHCYNLPNSHSIAQYKTLVGYWNVSLNRITYFDKVKLRLKSFLLIENGFSRGLMHWSLNTKT